MRNLLLWLIVVAVLIGGTLYLRSDGEDGVQAGEGGSAPVIEPPQASGGGKGRLLSPRQNPGSDDEPVSSGKRGVLAPPSKPSVADQEPKAESPEAQLNADASVGSDSGPTIQEPQAGRGGQIPAVTVSAPNIGARLELEILAASALFHFSPPKFHDWLSSKERGLTEDRKTLALAFNSAFAGTQQSWDSVRAHLSNSPEVNEAEFALFEQACGQRSGMPNRSSAFQTPLGIAMHMSLMERVAQAQIGQGDYVSAAKSFSSVLLDEIGAPWEADPVRLHSLTDSLRSAQQNYRWNRNADWPSVDAVVEDNDSLIAIRKRFLQDSRFSTHVMCTGLIDRANGLNGRYLKAGKVLRIPTETPHMLVDLSSRWALYMFGDEVAEAWQVGIGAPKSPTAEGIYHIGEKLENPDWGRPDNPPDWWPEGEAFIQFGDPRNALGTRWMTWEDDFGPTGLAFHGTSAPETIGGAHSLGCVRMKNEEVEQLFEILPRGARVVVQP